MESATESRRIVTVATVRGKVQKSMKNYRRDVFCLLEAGLTALFFVQAVRFLYGTLYAHVSSAALVSLTVAPEALVGQPGIVRPAEAEIQLAIVGAALFMPLISIVLGRLWFGMALSASLVAVGRVLLTANGGTTLGVIGAALAVGGGALYFSLNAVRRPGILPAGLVLGFAADQIIRLYSSTLDLTVRAEFLTPQTILSAVLFLIAALAALIERFGTAPNPRKLKGEISGWSAFALGGLLYLEFAVLGLPNIVAHRAGLDFNAIAPWLIGATLLPLAAEVRGFARSFLSMFDGRYRGWVWFLLVALLIVFGFRFGGIGAAAALIGAQFMICLSFWWIAQPTDGKRNFTAISMIFGAIFFILLTGADFLTFEYAFIRGVQEPAGSLLRAFRGLGLAVALISALLVCLPAIVARKRLPWSGGKFIETLAGIGVVALGMVAAISFSRPVPMQPPLASDTLRIATLNLHSGFSLYYGADMPGVAAEIRQNGVDVLLLQEVEGGRLTSYGVDQAAWLARELGMQLNYFATNEGLHGLAILSRLPIESVLTAPLSTQSRATGIQFVRIRAQDGETIDLYNTALTLIFRGGALSVEQQEEEQIRQMLEVFDFIKVNDSLERRSVLGGTFNHAPGGDIYIFLTQNDFIDPFKDYPTERAVTLRLVNEAPVRVDYLWLKGIDPQFVGVAPIIQSNHNLAIVEVKLQ